MAVGTGYSKISTSGLTFCYDVADILNSYIGEPTTNLITPAANSYPTTGNSWGTYNTNQYCGSNGCGNFWPIPSISSVTNNIVTTSSAHPMRSFDVLRPQTSGGGLTANTDYVVKKISSTQFSLHSYNSSQDGSQGYINPSTGYFKVYDDYMNDVRVSINATNFPTSWWGAPHLPNSGLVKEIITNGFDVYPQKTDCIRLHWHRPDGVTDGMAYNVNAVFTQNVNVTASFWARAVDPNAVGQSISYQNYTYGVTSATSYSMGCTLGPVGVWQKYSYTFNSPNNNAISYWFPSTGPMTVDIANIQIEQNGHATSFTTSSRSNTQGLLDLTTNKFTVDLTNAAYDSSGNIVINSSTGMFIPKNSAFYTNTWSWEFVVKFNSNTGSYQGIVWAEGSTGSGDSGYQYLLSLYNHTYFHYRITNTTSGWGNTNTPNISFTPTNYNHIVWIFNNGTTYIYINGELWHYDTSRGSYNGGSDSKLWLGVRNDLSYALNGYLPVAKMYNRQLNQTEIRLNYNHYKTRFNLP